MAGYGQRQGAGRVRCAVLLSTVLLLLATLPVAAQAADPFAVPADLTGHAVLSCRDLTVAGGSVITSEGLETGAAEGEQGHVRSNGDVLLDGGPEVHGDATAGPGRQVILSGQPATVTGAQTSAAAPFDCVPIDLAALETALAADNDNASLPLTGKGDAALGGADGRFLELKGRDSLELPAGRYLLSGLKLTGNSRLTVAGPVEILVSGEIDVAGGSHLNLDGNPWDVRLWSSGASVSLGSQSIVQGFVYAPAAEVHLAGRSKVVGGVQGELVDVVGGSRVRRVVDDAPPQLIVDTPQDGDVVEVCEIAVTGSASDGQGPATVTVNGAPVEVAEDGTFSHLASLDTEDPGLLVVTATDAAGNSTTVEVRVSIVPPTVALTQPPPGSLVGQRIVDLAGTSGTATQVTVNGTAATVAGDGTFALPGFDLGADGLVSLSLVASNCGGTATATAVLDLDTAPPVVAIDSPSAGALFGATPITVSGSVEDAHLTSVTVNGVAAVIDGQRFTAEGVTLSEGANTLVATATDALGRSTDSAPVTVELDTTAPTVDITAPATNSVVATATITVQGEVSDPNLSSVTVNGVAATVDGTSFSAAGVALSEGDNFLVAVATDALGNTAESPSVVVVLDTLAPTVTLDAGALPALTDEPAVTATGTVSDPHLDGVTVNGVTASVAGEGWVAEAIPLSEGANELVATATDTLGHSASTPPASVVLDTLAPQIAITAPAPGDGFDRRTLSVSGTVSDPHLDTVTVLGVAAVVTDGTFTASGVELPEGESEIVARAVDLLGHAADAAPVPVVVDTLAPVVRLDSPQDPLVTTASVTVTGTAEDPHLQSVTVAGQAATLAPDGSFSVAGVPLTEGPNEITATADDSFGHSTVSEPVLYVLDTTPPVVTITAPLDGQVVTSLEAAVRGQVTEANLATVTVNGVEATVAEDGSYTVTVPLSDGANVLTAVATDRVGLTGETSIKVFLDSLPPAVSLDTPPAGTCLPAGTPVTLAGAFADPNPATGLEGQPPAVQVEVRTSDGTTASYVGQLSADGLRWSVDGVDPGAADGTAAATVTGTDVLGNAARAAASWRVDAAAPSVVMTLDGTPFAGTAAGAAPVAGAQPALFNRAVAGGVEVDDGAGQAPPAATLTLDGTPYTAGTPVSAEGDHVLAASATDCAGRTTTVHAFFRIDRTPPALVSSAPAAGARLTTAPASFSGSADEALSVVTVAGAAAAVTGTTFSRTPYAAVEGDNTVAVELVDLAGNRSIHSVPFALRTAPLTLDIFEGGAPMADGAAFLRPVHPELRSNDPEATVAATLDGAPFVSGSEVATAGAHTLQGTATDSFGRSASAAVSFEIDLGDGPTVAITAPSDGAVLPGPSTAVSGTATGNGVTVTVNGVPAELAGDGTWTADAVPLEPDGITTLVAEARDGRGRSASAGVSVRVTSSGPQVLILDPADGAVTNRDAIDVAGVVVGGARATADGIVTVSGPLGAAQSVALDSDGAFRVLDVPLTAGANTLSAEIVDPQGRPGGDSVTVSADFNPPAVSFEADGAALTEGASFGAPITLAVVVGDDVGTPPAPVVRLNGADRPEAAAPRTEIAVAEEGGYVVAVVATDAAGNEARAERSFILDFGGCALNDVHPVAGAAVSGSAVTLAGRSGAAAAVAVRVPDGAGGVTDYPAQVADGTFLAGDVPLPVVGVNALALVCTDAAGVETVVDHPIERLPAGEGPTVTITAPADGALLDADAVTVDGTVSAGEVTVNGLAATVDASADTFRATGVPLVEGPNVLAARAVDGAGGSATDRVVVVRDSRAPQVQITRPDNKSRVGVPGSGVAAVEVSGLVDVDDEPHLASVVVSTSAGSTPASVDAATGAWVASGVPLDPAAGPDVLQTVTVTATDALGHAGTSTTGVYLDPDGPAVVLDAPTDLTWYGAGAAAQIGVTGDAWAAEGAAVSINGVDLDPAALAWESAGADGRRHVRFSTSIATPTSDGPFAVIARVSELDGGYAQDRRLLFRDTGPPRVVEMVPADGTTGVDPNSQALVLFSEPVLHATLAAADGLQLLRGGTDAVAGSRAVAGQAAAFVPAVALAAGESYTFRAGQGITDLAGNPLAAPFAAGFTVAEPATAAAPSLEPLPSVLCADLIVVRGTAVPGATVEVRDGDLAFRGFADPSGLFEVSVPSAGSGYHLLRVRTLDPVSGAASPEATAVVRIDCSAPRVTEARFERDTATIRVVFSEAVDPATVTVGDGSAAVRLTDAEAPAVFQSATVTFVNDTTLALALDAASTAWWRERPVRLRVGPPAADLEGNPMQTVFETVFFPGSSEGLAGGFLFGETYDDASGRPLGGATARLYTAGAALPGAVAEGAESAPVTTALTDGRGRYTFADDVPAGRYVLVLTADGHTPVYRRLALAPVRGTVPFDSRLTPRAAAAGSVDPATGGSVTSAGLVLTADAAALPGSDPLSVHLTALSGQGLPDFLPLGWTPAAAAEVHAETGGAALAAGDAGWTPGGVRLTVPLPDWLAAERELVAVRHDPATGRWLALPVAERLAADASNSARARVAVTGPGMVAFVVADLDPTQRPAAPAAAGEPLVGVAALETTPELTAELTLDPPVVPPTGRSQARVVARSVDGSTPWPSGLAVQAYLEEKLILAGGGGQLLEAPFSVDLVLYHPALSSAEQSGAAADAAGAMEFVVSPSPRAAQVLLDVGYENIRLFPFPEEVEREPVVGPAGGGVEGDDGVVLTIPEGALSVTIPASAGLLPADELAALAPVAGFDTLAAVRVELGGQALGRPATLSVPVPGAPAAVAGDPRLILAERVDAPADGRGAYPRLVSRARLEGSGDAARAVASPDQAGALPLDGVVREGLYLVLRAQTSMGFATGLVHGGAGAVLDGARVVADGAGGGLLGTADVTRLGGRYSVPVSAGTERTVRALHPTQDETAAGTLASLAAGAVATLDLTVTTVPPSVESLSPPDGALDQPVGTEVSALLSEPLSAATVTGSTLTVELAGPNGGGSGVFIDGDVSLVDDLRVVFTPDRPLPAGRTFLATFSGGVADAGGTFYAGPPVTWTFTTSTALAPGGQVHPELFHVRLPENGVAEIHGEPGALPSITAGATPWIVSPEIEGPVADPVRDSFAGAVDGSFSGTVGHPPEFPATLGSRIWVQVFDPTGQLAAEFRVGPFETADGKGFVAPPGEEVVFRSAEGIEVTAPAGAFEEPTVVRVESLDPATAGVPTPEGLGVGAYVRLDFEGQANESLRLAVPAPAGAQPGAKVFIGEPVSLPWGRRLSILSLGAVEQRADGVYLSNAEELQPFADDAGATAGGSVGAGQRVAGASVQRVTGNLLPRSFRNSLKQEFAFRSSAVWYYESGVQWAFLAGSAGAFPIGIGIGMEAIYNALADLWVYVPTPHDWNGGFILPVLADTPLQMVRRDTATGWILSETAYDPIPADGDGVIEIGFLPGSPQQPPLLTDARPFRLVRFRAPADGVREPLALEVEVEGTTTGTVVVSSVPDFALAEGTGLALYDLAPALPSDPEAEPAAPKAGPTLTVCDADQAWGLSAMAGSDEMLLAIAPGDLDAADAGRFELQYDLPLEEVADKPPEQVARLLDLGPREGCASSTAAGYPRSIPVVVELSEGATRLLVTATADLPAGHRFRLEVETASLIGRSTGLPVWSTTPHRFEFGTREVPGEPLAGLPAGTPSLGTTDVARDLLKLGNLLLVASENGDLVAIDTSDSTHAEGLRRHAVKNRGLQSFTRALATDGHNRIFYAGQFGPLWAIKAARLEDVREASEPCLDPPAWAAGLPCFSGVLGSVRVAYALGYADGLTASEWLAAGTLPSGTPMDLEVLTQDENGATLPLDRFAAAYGVADEALSGLVADAEGIYTFDLPVTSTLVRGQAGAPEPSLPPGSEPAPAVAAWRQRVCDGEEDYDRYQRVTVDNLTTGQSWSVDVANPWPDEAGDGTATIPGVRARRGDRLRVRYNLRALGHVAVMGSGVTVVDLNRFYRLTQSSQSGGAGQCGRRLGKFEGQEIEWPACAPGSIDLQGMAMTPNVATLGETGCTDGVCRGDGRIDVYTPLVNVGVVHAFSEETDPGELAPQAELAACIRNVGGVFTFLRDAVTASDVEWVYRGVHGDLSGDFSEPEGTFEPRVITDDLLAVSLGNGGVYVFSVGQRSVRFAPFGPSLIGHLKVPGHTAFRLQVDPVRKLLFAGGTDTASGEPVIDVWDLASVNGAPGLDFQPVPRASLHAGWSTDHIGLDGIGTGLVYTWDGDGHGVQAVPFESARFRLSGLYRPEDEDGESGIDAEERATARFVPLGVPVRNDDGDPSDDAADEREDERTATAAFKVRVALPGSLGPELTARVQSLRALPAARHLGRDDVGAAVVPPGGPGWPASDVVVRLRRVNVGADEGVEPADPEAGPLSVGYHLYESVETVLLVADPRARRGYARQDAPGSEADEAGQCRRCDWPAYLPDPDSTDPAADDVEELLAGRYVRVYLDADAASPVAVRTATQAAVDWFVERGANYPLPTGWAAVAAPAAAVPSPLQVGLADPPANPAMWSPGEAGVGASLTGGELLLEQADHAVRGRSIPFVFERHYRSGTLGYGPLGSAGWWSPLFSRLRELPSGEVVYHDGMGHAWRFPPATVEPLPEGYTADDAGSYHVPEGLYLRLQKLSGDQGWRLINPRHGTARFDAAGRLISVGDRLHRSGLAGEQGSSLSLRYDPFGQLISVIDDLGRRYDLAYYDDPRPVAEGGDGPRYGLLRSITDFVDREVEYRWDGARRLTEVRLPEVTNPTDAYAEFSYEGDSRPALRYGYDPAANVSAAESDTTGLLHGDFAALRLADVRLPRFAAGGSDDPRARFGYDGQSGRLATVAFPTPGDVNSGATAVRWQLTAGGADPSAGPAGEVTVRAPWGHDVVFGLTDGRVTSRRETLTVERPGQAPADEVVETTFSYADDGRRTDTLRPDGGRTSLCYADGTGGAGCPSGGGGEGVDPGSADRLSDANVVAEVTAAVEPGGQGSAAYTEIVTEVDYQADNLPTAVTDGEGRGIDLAVPEASTSDTTRFQTEDVSASFSYDAYGRPDQVTGGGDGGPLVKLGYGENAKGVTGAGLVNRIERGSGDHVASTRELEYDAAYNVEEVRTSYGELRRATHDAWDRPVREVKGLAEDGALAPVGAGPCSVATQPESAGAVVERAFDAAGHVVRERRLQDHVDPGSGQVECRWVETRFRYNLREQIIAVEQTHLSDPTQAGAVSAQPRQVLSVTYDEHGRTAERRAAAVSRPDLVTTYSYDAAGRVVATRTGGEGERSLGYDEMSRVVLRTDGDEGTWRGRFDVWDRLYHEEMPTGAVRRTRFNRAHQPVEEQTFDGDPTTDPGAQLLELTRSDVTSFNAVSRLVEELTDSGERRVTEQIFDQSGRVTQVVSGPEGEPGRVDATRARRELELVYEPSSGRVAVRRTGGAFGQPPLHEQRLEYALENATPWPDRSIVFESVPGQPDLVRTFTTSFERDVLGRVLSASRSDGQRTSFLYDRGSTDVLRTRTAAGSEESYVRDGRGLPVKVERPDGRGATLYAYDLDGALLRQVTTTADAADLWETVYSYDATGRVTGVAYADGTSEQRTYRPDSQVATVLTRDGVTLTFGYDAANRLESVTPSAATPGTTRLDAGDAYAYDELSRPTRLQRGRPGVGGYDPALTVAYPSYDLASRPAAETVGARDPLSWTYDVFSNPVETRLPAGPGRDGAGAFTGFSRDFDTLDRLTGTGGLGTNALSAVPLGADWTWGGLDRLYAMDTRGALGTAVRYGYHAGAGPQVPGTTAVSASDWKLGRLTWGAGGTAGPTAEPATVWGDFGYGWRGNEGAPSDGAKIGREVLGGTNGLGLLAGLGWSWGYDTGVRLTEATAWTGDLEGNPPPAGEPADRFSFSYGPGDELLSKLRQTTGQSTNYSTGDYGRITARNGQPFTYDGVGRRLEDDRFVYRWDWRGQLVSVTVKDTWPDEDGDGELDTSPYAGHHLRYDYDATGRLTRRLHEGVAAAGGTRPFIEERQYVWEGDRLAAEAAYAAPGATNLRWRRTYVPGPTGLDDPTQVVVEIAQPGSPFSGTTRTYTYLRDELGTVMGLVAEDEGTDPSEPPIPVRYRYTPYGEAHAETGPELQRAHFASDATTVDTTTGPVSQTVADDTLAAPGALVLDWSLPLAEATLPSGLIVEHLVAGSGWTPVDPARVAVGPEATDGVSSNGGDGQLLVLLTDGWEAGRSYRLRLAPTLADTLGRPFGGSETLEWSIPAGDGTGPVPAVTYDQQFPVEYESWSAAGESCGGRFPAGQSRLFQGLWTDPVTGLGYARARWFDARNATFLTEDPRDDFDSPNIYAFVAWMPSMAIDPFGEESIRQWFHFEEDIEEGRKVRGYTKKGVYVAWNVLTFGFLSRHDRDFEETGGFYGDRDAYLGKTAKNLGRTAVEGTVSLATGGAGGAGAKTLLGAVARGAAGGAVSAVATTGAVDVYERATGGEAATAEEYITSAVSGAVFGGAGGALAHRMGSARAASNADDVDLDGVSSRRTPSREVRALPEATNVADHHIIPKFRGKSAPYADFIRKRGIDVDEFTVTLAHGKASHHLKFIHGQGRWNQRWMDWIDANPNATAKDIYQFAGQMMDEFGLSGLVIHPYGG